MRKMCDGCDGAGSLMQQLAKAACIKVGGRPVPFADGRPGVYYMDSFGREMEMKTIGGACTDCGGSGWDESDDPNIPRPSGYNVREKFGGTLPEGGDVKLFAE